MVRLLLVLSPAACSLAGIAVSEILRVYLPFLSFSPVVSYVPDEPSDVSVPDSSQLASSMSSSSVPAPTSKKAKNAKNAKNQPPVVQTKKSIPETPKTIPTKKEGYIGIDMAVVVIIGILALSTLYVLHSVYFTSEAYSSPSIVLMAHGPNGRVIFDDFREAYSWLRYNTPEDAKVMSWWDYGYQISAMANRTVIVDNNTRNNSHIAQVGAAFASTEAEAVKIMRHLDADYALVIFGGLIGYSGDDINKFLWMVRIAGGVDPKFKEADYFTPEGYYKIGKEGSLTMRRSLMYKLCYYNFDKTKAVYDRGAGFDRVRDEEVGEKNIRLVHFDEAFTSEHWMVRIYKLKPEQNRERLPRHLRRKK